MKKNIFNLDKTDKEIIEILQNDSQITHSKIADQLGLSQPTIGVRIKKLEEAKIISHQIGVNLKENRALHLVKVEMINSKPEEAMEMAKYCPYVINALKQSGVYNISMYLACTNLKRIDYIIDLHFRNREWIKKIRMDIITDIARDFILPIDFKIEDFSDVEEECDIETCPYCIHDGDFH